MLNFRLNGQTTVTDCLVEMDKKTARSKELEQQLADSAEYQKEKNKCISDLREYKIALAEANALLKKLEWCVEYRGRYWCHICDRPHDKGHAPDCRLAAHLNPGDTDGE